VIEPLNHCRNTMERKTQNLSERIYCDILKRVLDGEYNEGDRLPTEHALASRFESSRTTVREALAQLRADGIIATRHGSGTTVQRCPDPNLLKFAPLTSLSDIKRCYEFRVVTESGAAALAAVTADETDVAAIEKEWNSLQTIVEAGGLGANDDFAFHMAIAYASKNQFFIAALSCIQEQVVFSINLLRNLSLLKSVEQQRLVQHEHLAILDAIRRHDAQGAGEPNASASRAFGRTDVRLPRLAVGREPDSLEQW